MQNDSAFTARLHLIEAMIVVAILGTLAAVAIPAFMRYMRKSKTTEAMQGIKKIYDGARTYYLRGERPCHFEGA